MAKRTALYDEHLRLNGRMVDFGGWELPVQYSGVMDEHLACRSAAGLFDVSHMGEILVGGTDAESFLNWLVTNDVSRVSVGQAQYSVMCNERGGIVDDLVVYRLARDRFLIVVNAANVDKDVSWIEGMAERFRELKPVVNFQVSNVSEQYTQIALRGRKSETILKKITDIPLSPIKTYWFAEGAMLKGTVPAILARTGYTGEDGFEVYVPWERGPEVWRAILEAGKADGLKPCGLGSRDTLRLEMKYPLYGHELTDETNPLEAGLGWVTKLEKGDFVGRSPLRAAKTDGLRRALVGIRLLDRGIPRQGYPVFTVDGSRRIGEITSGTQSPSLKQAIGIAYVERPSSATGTRCCVEIRGNRVAAETVPTPFYKRPYEPGDPA